MSLLPSTDAVGGSPRARRLLHRSRYRAPVTDIAVIPSDPVAYAAQIGGGTNDVRRAQGLPALGGSRCAKDAAVQRATALIGRAELTHAPLGGVIADCTAGTTAAKNLSKAAATPAAVIDALMGSPGATGPTCSNPALTEIGVGCTLDSKSMLCSQVFRLLNAVGDLGATAVVTRG